LDNPCQKRGLIQSLHNRTSTICQDQKDLAKEINNFRHDLQLNGYPQGFIDSVINPKGSSRPKTEEKPGFMHVRALGIFYGLFFLLALIESTWSQVFV
jgi:hypothetical protein